MTRITIYLVSENNAASVFFRSTETSTAALSLYRLYLFSFPEIAFRAIIDIIFFFFFVPNSLCVIIGPRALEKRSHCASLLFKDVAWAGSSVTTLFLLLAVIIAAVHVHLFIEGQMAIRLTGLSDFIISKFAISVEHVVVREFVLLYDFEFIA